MTFGTAGGQIAFGGAQGRHFVLEAFPAVRAVEGARKDHRPRTQSQVFGQHIAARQQALIEPGDAAEAEERCDERDDEEDDGSFDDASYEAPTQPASEEELWDRFTQVDYQPEPKPEPKKK